MVREPMRARPEARHNRARPGPLRDGRFPRRFPRANPRAVILGTPAPPLVLLAGVRAIDPSSSLDGEVDIVVERGVITRVGPGAATAELRAVPGARVLSGRHLLVTPAFVDLHAHLREPGQ